MVKFLHHTGTLQVIGAHLLETLEIFGGSHNGIHQGPVLKRFTILIFARWASPHQRDGSKQPRGRDG